MMKNRKCICRCLIFLGVISCLAYSLRATEWTGRNTDRIAFPIGGIGSGMFCVEGTGAISHVSLEHGMNFFHEPTTFAAVYVKGKNSDSRARVLEGPVPEWKFFGIPNSGTGSTGRTYGLPRFRECTFTSRFPFCEIALRDDVFPVETQITGFSPFIPGDGDASSFPAGTLDYTLKNTGEEPLEVVFSFHTRNFMGGDKIGAFPAGFRLVGPRGECAVSVMNQENVAVDHCWFRGGWWDAFTMTWNNIASGAVISNPPDDGKAPGASIYVPLRLGVGESKTVRLLVCWYVPESSLVIGGNSALLLQGTPSQGTAGDQQPVTGFQGLWLVNTYDNKGDRHEGRIVSASFQVSRKYLHFLVGGGKGKGVGVALHRVPEDGSLNLSGRLFTARGKDLEKLEWATWDLSELQGETVRIEIFDEETDGWGHINADHFVMSDQPLVAGQVSADAVLLADFEGGSFGNWEVLNLKNESTRVPPKAYKPWYSVKFESVDDVAKEFTTQYPELRRRSELFAETLRKSTLPTVVMEAVEANLSIIKSPTILRHEDGRLWGWEGNNDHGGSCPGTCTHVWNYAQSICHLFPDLERGIRRTEFYESLMKDGRQAFRSNLPFSPGGVGWDAADGQLGTIMRMHREWKISGDRAWLEEFYPRIKRSMDWAIQEWDPRETGLLEESHHNTYDINYVGIEGHCGSFYLGALAAMIHMGNALGEDVSRYETLLKKGKHRMETELFNGEYFIQRIPGPGTEGNPDGQSAYYRAVAEKVNQQGMKYQYGTGCLSDGVLGFWMARVCGIDEDLVNPEMIRSHLLSIYKYNFKKDLSAHANPQRPAYAIGKEGGLLLCSWPHGEKPLLPFVYSDEVWTGIEYQVASHLMFIGETEKGLEIVQTCRERYDGTRRNPFNEFECGHWYARAMASFALLQGYTGVRFDAVEKTLYVRKSAQPFTVPLFTQTGYGLVTFHPETGVSVKTVEGAIPAEKTVVEE